MHTHITCHATMPPPLPDNAMPAGTGLTTTCLPACHIPQKRKKYCRASTYASSLRLLLPAHTGQVTTMPHACTHAARVYCASFCVFFPSPHPAACLPRAALGFSLPTPYLSLHRCRYLPPAAARAFSSTCNMPEGFGFCRPHPSPAIAATAPYARDALPAAHTLPCRIPCRYAMHLLPAHTGCYYFLPYRTAARAAACRFLRRDSHRTPRTAALKALPTHTCFLFMLCLATTFRCTTARTRMAARRMPAACRHFMRRHFPSALP